MPSRPHQGKVPNFRRALNKNPKNLISLYKSAQSQCRLRRILSGCACMWRKLTKDDPALCESNVSIQNSNKKKRQSTKPTAPDRLLPNCKPMGYTKRSMNVNKNVRNSWRKSRLQPKKVVQRIPEQKPRRVQCSCPCSKCNGTTVEQLLDICGVDTALLEELSIAHSSYEDECAQSRHIVDDDDDVTTSDEDMLDVIDEEDMIDEDDIVDIDDFEDTIADNKKSHSRSNKSNNTCHHGHDTAHNPEHNVDFLDYTDNEIYFYD